MDIIRELTDPMIDFARTNPIAALIVLIILAYLVYRKPVFFLSLLCLGLLIVGVVYIVMEASSSGVSKKERFIHKDMPVENSIGHSGLKF